MIDIFKTETLEIHISYDGKCVWINTEDGCLLRAYRIENLSLVDDRIIREGDKHVG